MAQEVPLGYDGNPWRARRPRAETRVAGHALGRGRAGHGPRGESRRERSRLARLPWKPASARGLEWPGGAAPGGRVGVGGVAPWASRGRPGLCHSWRRNPIRPQFTWRCQGDGIQPGAFRKNVQGGNPTLSHQDRGDIPRLHPSRRSVASPPVYPREALFPQLFLCHLQPAPRQVLRLRQMLGWSSEALRGIWLLSLGSPGMGT